jgi:tetratricopeptide (TPR) repeat protein
MRTRRAGTLAVAFAAGLSACRAAPAPPPAESIDPPIVEPSGCRAFTAGPVCELSDDSIVRLIITRAPSDRIEVRSDVGDVAVLAREETDGAERRTVRLPAGASVVNVVLVRGTATSRAAVLRVAPYAAPAWHDAALKLRAEGRADEALALALPHVSDGGAGGAFAKGIVARLRLMRGEHASAARLVAEAAEAHAAAGRISNALEDRMPLAFVLTEHLHDFTAARAALDAASPLGAQYPDGRAVEPYYRALLARRLGDIRGQLALIAEAEQRARRLGLTRELREAEVASAMASHALGRSGESCARYTALLASTATEDYPCARPRRLVNYAVASLDAASAKRPGEACAARPAELLEEAIALYQRQCEDAEGIANARLELARARLASGDVPNARAALAESRATTPEPTPDLGVDWLLIEAQIAIAVGDPQRALTAYTRTERLADRLAWPGARADAVAGRATALEGMGKLDEAANEFARAEALLDDATLLVPAGIDRATFVASRDASARGRVDLLLRRSRPGDALRAALQSRARLLRGLEIRSALEHLGSDERARWESAVGDYQRARARLDEDAEREWQVPERLLPSARARRQSEEAAVRAKLEAALASIARPKAHRGSDVRAPDGDLVLAYHPTTEGWAAFASHGDDVIARRFVLPRLDGGGEALADALLTPFDAELRAARRVRVIPFGDLWEVDVHALPWHGRPLIASLPVEYAIDGRSSARSALACTKGDRALVVVDPTGNLPSARDEGRDVAVRFGAAERQVTVLAQQAATGAAIRRQLATAALLHFAGHAAHASGDALRSSLFLHGSDRLEVADILALSSAPRLVVLSACDSGRKNDDTLGLAQAFVLAGTRAAVAPVRAVDDGAAQQIARAFYDADPCGPEGAGQALRRAQLALREADATADWAAYRVFVP